MTSVDSISPVNICTDCVSWTLIVPECFGLMGACVCPQHRVFVDVVGIRTTSARVILGEAKRIEILVDGNDWVDVIVVVVNRRWEAFFNDLTGY